MTLEQMERYGRDIGYWAVALATAGAAWAYSKEAERFDGLSLLLVIHAAWTLRNWFAGPYGKLTPEETYILDDVEPPDPDGILDEVQKRR